MAYKRKESLKTGAEQLKNALADKRMKRDGEISEYLSVQLLTPEPEGNMQKYRRIGALESVALLQPKKTLASIKEACTKHFKMEANKSCDLLVSDRGPVVRHIGELNLDTKSQTKRIVHCRFITKKTENVKVSDMNNQENREPVTTKSTPVAKTSFLPPVKTVPKSVSPSVYMKAGQFIPPKKKVVQLILEEFQVQDSKWLDPFPTKFLIDMEVYATGGFRQVFKAKCIQGAGSVVKGEYVVKQYLEDKAQEITNLIGDTLSAHTRKNVQLHMVAQHMANSMAHEAPEEFGDTFIYDKVYYSEYLGVPVSIEKFFCGTFKKYINNDGKFDFADTSELMLKAQAFMHFTHKKNDSLMVTDIQGFDYLLTDPEIATIETKGEDNKWNFCSGNCYNAIANFFELHNCNKYCEMLKL